MRNVNLKTVSLIKSFEALSLTPYKDLVGVWTIGWGTTYYPNGKKVTKADPAISRDQADYFLMHEITEKSAMLEQFISRIGLTLNDNEFGALVSFVYNCGIGPVVEGGRSLNQALKSKNKAAIADTILIYNKGTFVGVKKTIKGLVRRRNAERQLFLTPVA